jgi:hypothetical protein
MIGDYHWNKAMDDPAFQAALAEGRSDLAANRVKPWPTAFDIAYAAGLFDGEGTISVDKKLSLSIAVSGNYRPMHEWMQEHFGGSITSGGQNHFAGDVMNDGRVVVTDSKKEWKWRLNGQEALDFLTLIEPYLIEKKSQAQLVLADRWLWPSPPVHLTWGVRTMRQQIRDGLKQIRKDNGE